MLYFPDKRVIVSKKRITGSDILSPFPVQVPAIVKALHRQMKDRSVKTRRGCFNLLAEIVHVAPGALANHVQVILPGIQYSLAGPATASSCFFQLAF